MSQPPAYTRTTDFAQEESLNVGGRTTVRADRVNAELDALGTTANALVTNIGLIQRDDGALRDGIVSPQSLSTSTIAFLGGSNFNPRGVWASAQSYTRLDLVENSGSTYVALSTHTSGVSFATDLASGLWQLFPGQQTATATPFTPTGALVSTNVQAAISEVQTNVERFGLASLAFDYGAL